MADKIKCSSGFLMERDIKTGEMKPFFVKVRSEDIVNNNGDPINQGGSVNNFSKYKFVSKGNNVINSKTNLGKTYEHTTSNSCKYVKILRDTEELLADGKQICEIMGSMVIDPMTEDFNAGVITNFFKGANYVNHGNSTRSHNELDVFVPNTQFDDTIIRPRATVTSCYFEFLDSTYQPASIYSFFTKYNPTGKAPFVSDISDDMAMLILNPTICNTIIYPKVTSAGDTGFAMGLHNNRYISPDCVYSNLIKVWGDYTMQYASVYKQGYRWRFTIDFNISGISLVQ